MKKLLIAFLIIFVAVQANAQKWISLFDGKTTNGWHSYGKTEPTPRHQEHHCKVNSGTIKPQAQ